MRAPRYAHELGPELYQRLAEVTMALRTDCTCGVCRRCVWSHEALELLVRAYGADEEEVSRDA